MELISVKEYCKRENITDAGARKRVSSGFVKSIILDDITYLIVENTRDQEVKDLKAKLRSANDKIKLLKAEKQVVLNQEAHIEKLENKIAELESKLFNEIAEQKTLMRDVITHQTQMLSLPARRQG